MADTDILKSPQKSFTAYTEPGYQGNENRFGDTLYQMSKQQGLDRIDPAFPSPGTRFPAHMGSQSTAPSKEPE